MKKWTRLPLSKFSEYEKEQLREKLDDEVWEDLKFEEENDQESIEMNFKLLDFDKESAKV